MGDWSDPNNNPPDCVGGKKELLGDRIVNDQGGYQYLMGAMDSLGWDWKNTPGGDTQIRKNLPYLKRNLFDTYFIDGQPMVILDPTNRYAGSYNLDLIRKIMPERLGQCGESGKDYLLTTGQYAHNVINAQNATEPFLVVSNVLYALLKELGAASEASKVLTLANQMLDADVANNPDPRDVDCWPGQIFSGLHNNLLVVGKMENYYRQGLWYWQNYYNAKIAPMVTPTPTPPYPLGDINHDGVVDLLDFVLVSNAFGSSNASADLNSDGRVDLLDFVILSNNFGKTG